jgi:hypothetical protein
VMPRTSHERDPPSSPRRKPRRETVRSTDATRYTRLISTIVCRLRPRRRP